MGEREDYLDNQVVGSLMEDMGTSLGATAIALFVVKEVMSYLKLTATKNGKNGNKYHEYERWKAMEEALKSNTNATKNLSLIHI